MGRGLAIAIVMSSVCATSSCASDEARVPASSPPAAAFENVVYADLAGDERHVWALVAGRDGDAEGLGMRVFERTNEDDWRALPPIPWTTQGRGGFSIAAWRGQPCVAVPAGGMDARSVIACMMRGRWRSISERSPVDHASIGRLTAHEGSLFTIATRSAARQGRTAHAVYRWSRGRWQQIGRPLHARAGIPALGTTGGGTVAPDVLLENSGVGPATRVVYRFSAGRWAAVGKSIEDVAEGPNVSGPVSDAGTTWAAVTEARRMPWRFSVMHRSSDSGRWHRRTLNVGSGNAQGAVYPAGAGVWAVWVESLPRSQNAAFPFSEKIWAARVDRDQSAPIRLHAGPSVGPGNFTIVDGAGTTWVLYMTTTTSHGMQIHVRPLLDRTAG